MDGLQQLTTQPFLIQISELRKRHMRSFLSPVLYTQAHHIVYYIAPSGTHTLNFNLTPSSVCFLRLLLYSFILYTSTQSLISFHLKFQNENNPKGNIISLALKTYYCTQAKLQLLCLLTTFLPRAAYDLESMTTKKLTTRNIIHTRTPSQEEQHTHSTHNTKGSSPLFTRSK